MNKDFFLIKLFSKDANNIIVAEVDGEKVNIIQNDDDEVILKLDDYSEFKITKDGTIICTSCGTKQYIEDADLIGNSLKIECSDCGLELKLISKIRYDFKLTAGIKSLTEGSIYLVEDRSGKQVHCKYEDEKFFSLESEDNEEVVPSKVLTELFLTPIERAKLKDK